MIFEVVGTILGGSGNHDVKKTRRIMANDEGEARKMAESVGLTPLSVNPVDVVVVKRVEVPESTTLLLQEASEWARHYSTVRMTVTTFLITLSTGILAFRWGDPLFVRFAVVVWVAAVLIFGAFSMAEWSQMNHREQHLATVRNQSLKRQGEVPKNAGHDKQWWLKRAWAWIIQTLKLAGAWMPVDAGSWALLIVSGGFIFGCIGSCAGWGGARDAQQNGIETHYFHEHDERERTEDAQGSEERGVTRLPALSPQAALTALESRLLAADDFQLRYSVRATGDFTADLVGAFRHRGEGIAQLTGSGTFDGQHVDLMLSSAEGNMSGGNAPNSFDQPTPPAITTALVLGLTRMGILHNLARLSAGQPPDHADGGVDNWVRAVEVRNITDENTQRTGGSSIGFGIEVKCQRTAEAILWLDENGLPVRRTQEVRFDDGTMQVVEEYEIIRLDL